jgi:hypothetical protein
LRRRWDGSTALLKVLRPLPLLLLLLVVGLPFGLGFKGPLHLRLVIWTLLGLMPSALL